MINVIVTTSYDAKENATSFYVNGQYFTFLSGRRDADECPCRSQWGKHRADVARIGAQMQTAPDGGYVHSYLDDEPQMRLF